MSLVSLIRNDQWVLTIFCSNHDVLQGFLKQKWKFIRIFFGLKIAKFRVLVKWAIYLHKKAMLKLLRENIGFRFNLSVLGKVVKCSMRKNAKNLQW